MYKRNIKARSSNHFCRGKASSTTYSESVSTALVIQHAKCRRPTMLSSMVCVALQYFFTLSHKWHDFRRKAIENKLSFDYPYNLCLKHFSFQEEFG